MAWFWYFLVRVSFLSSLCSVALVFCECHFVLCYNDSLLSNNGTNKILQEYEEALGQKINKDKTTMFFSKNKRNEVQEQIRESPLKFKQSILRTSFLIEKSKKLNLSGDQVEDNMENLKNKSKYEIKYIFIRGG